MYLQLQPLKYVFALESSLGMLKECLTHCYEAHLYCVDILCYLLGCFKICTWSSLRCFGPLVNHLTPVCWSRFGKSILNKLMCNFGGMENIVFLY